MLIPFDQLFRRHNIKAAGVLHLGANTGQEAAAYAAQGIERVVWVEALPKLHKALVNHVSNWPGQIALLGCLSDVDGQQVTFNVASNQGQSSSYLEFGTHAREHPTVKYVDRVELETVTVKTLLERYNITIDGGWFLNADLQGAELPALKGMGELLHKFDHAYIEVNVRELYKGCALVGEIDSYLAAFRFTGLETKMTGSGWGDKYYKRLKS